MAQISLQPRPKIPPIGFFEPISVNPEDMMTDVEFLLGILKKLNEIIVQTNANSKFIDEYTGKIEEIEGELIALQREMEQFEADINNEITVRFNAIVTELNSMIAAAVTQANAYTDTKFLILEDEIREITIGDITIYDPTTGLLSPLQTVIDNLYGTSRDDALTASEYDGLELTASTYDGYEITAFDYDKYGKSILMDVSA